MSNQPALEYETRAEFKIHGQSVRVHLGTLAGAPQDGIGGVTIRDHKARALARGLHDGFGIRDPKKIWVMVDLSESFTQKLPKRTTYHHSAQLFEALAPLIAALPTSKWEKKSSYATPYEKAMRAEARKRKQQLRGVPETLPPGEWRRFYERMSAGASEARRREVTKRWFEQDPKGYLDWLREPVDNWGWSSSEHDRTGSTVQPLATRDAEAILGLRDNYDADDVRLAWRVKSKTAHPDAGGSNEEFRRITEARDTLLNAVSMH